MSLFQPHPGSPQAAERPPRILIVDDDAAALRLLAVGLTGAGFDVATATSGEEALALITTSPPDALVLDYEMSGLNGAEVCARLRASEAVPVKELPVIMLTAHVAEADEIQCLESGANDFVTKPVSRAVLQARIQTQLRLRAYVRLLEEWRTIQEADLASARATQQAFLPDSEPDLPGWELYARFTPLIQVGGDIYGWQRLDDGRWLFWMADGTGHGAAAALITSLTAHLFSKAAETSGSPAEILASVNRDFLRVVGGSVFMTAFCAVIASDGVMTFCSAGHPPMLIKRQNGKVESYWPEKTILGLGEGLTIDDMTATLDKGDVALLYTDGLYSCKGQSGERLDHETVQRSVAEGAFGADPVADLIARVQAHSDGGALDDDLSVIALRRTG